MVCQPARRGGGRTGRPATRNSRSDPLADHGAAHTLCAGRGLEATRVHEIAPAARVWTPTSYVLSRTMPTCPPREEPARDHATQGAGQQARVTCSSASAPGLNAPWATPTRSAESRHPSPFPHPDSRDPTIDRTRSAVRRRAGRPSGASRRLDCRPDSELRSALSRRTGRGRGCESRLPSPRSQRVLTWRRGFRGVGAPPGGHVRPVPRVPGSTPPAARSSSCRTRSRPRRRSAPTTPGVPVEQAHPCRHHRARPTPHPAQSPRPHHARPARRPLPGQGDAVPLSPHSRSQQSRTGTPAGHGGSRREQAAPQAAAGGDRRPLGGRLDLAAVVGASSVEPVAIFAVTLLRRSSHLITGVALTPCKNDGAQHDQDGDSSRLLGTWDLRLTEGMTDVVERAARRDEPLPQETRK